MHSLAGCCDYMANKRTRLRMEIAVTTLPHTFKRIRLNLARSKEFPQGSKLHGYEFVAPLDDTGHSHGTLRQSHREHCRGRRCWEGADDESGFLVHKPGRPE